MDAHAATARHVADHGIARHGLAALRVAHHEPVHALHAHALRTAHAVDESLERRRFGRLDLLGLRIDLLQGLRHADVALADRREQMGWAGEREPFRGLLELRFGHAIEPAALDFAFENLLPELFGRRLGLALEHLPDLVPRAPGADVRQP